MIAEGAVAAYHAGLTVNNENMLFPGGMNLPGGGEKRGGGGQGAG